MKFVRVWSSMNELDDVWRQLAATDFWKSGHLQLLLSQRVRLDDIWPSWTLSSIKMKTEAMVVLSPPS
jgi:hypothetical protein